MPFMQLSEFMPSFGAKPNRVLGVFVSAEGLFLVELERLEEPNRFRVRQAREEAWQGQNAPWEDASALAETLRRLCATYGLSRETISVCLPRELFFIYERDFPPMGQREFVEAARWDIETNVPFAEGGYWAGFGRHGGAVELAAVPSAHGAEIARAMTAAGLGIEGLSMEPLRLRFRREGVRVLWRDAEAELSAASARERWTRELYTALYAAFRVYCPEAGIEFLPRGERAETARRWQTAGNVALACTFLMISLLFARNLWRLSAAEARLDDLRQTYALETRGRETMEILAGGQAAAVGAETALRKLSGERRSWYGVFSALGAAAVDGVYLTELDAQEDGALVCGGHAPDYARLAAYMERLEQGGAALREKPVLKESATDERGALRFKLRLRF